MDNSVKKNYMYNTVFEVLILIIPFITTPYVSRVLGAEGVGTYSYSYAMISYFVILSKFGSSTFGQREIAFYRDNLQELSNVFWNVFLFRVITTSFAILAYCGYLFLTKEVTTLNLIMIFFLIDITADVSWFFQGIEKFKKIVIRNSIIRFASMVCIFTFVKGKSDVWIYALILGVSSFLGNLSLWIELKKLVNKPTHINPMTNLKGMWLIFLPTISIQIYAVLDKSMIGWITSSTAENGFYEQAEKIARISITVVTSIGNVVMPRVANLFHKGDVHKAKDYIYKAYGLTWLLSIPIMVGLITTADYVIPVYLGDEYEKSVNLLRIFSFIVVFVSLANTTGRAYLIPTNQQNVYTVSVSIAAVINLIMNLILIPSIGAAGAAISSVVAEGVGSVIQIGYCCVKRQLALEKIMHSIWKYLLASTIMGIFIRLLHQILQIDLIGLMVMIMLGVISYFILLLVMKETFVKKEFEKAIIYFKKCIIS